MWSAVPGLLAVISAVGTALIAAGPHRPSPLRLAHVVMTVSMLGMVTVPTSAVPAVFVPAATVVLLALAIRLLSRRLDHGPNGLPCLLDLVGMLVLSTVTLVGTVTRDPFGHTGSHASVITAMGLQLAAGWAVAAVWLRTGAGAARLREVGVGTGWPRSGMAGSLVTVAAMAAMMLPHG